MKKEKIYRKMDIYKIELDYNIKQFDVFSEIDTRVIKILNVLNNEELITPTQKRIFCLYLETNSMREVGRTLKISREKVRKIIVEIKNKILIYGNFN